jgi:hypothetical protein
MDWRFLVTIIITGALGIITIVLALKLAKKRQPVWAYKTTKIIGLGSNAPPELKLTFNEQSVSDVYRTRVILFNKGNEPIVKGNVTESVAIHFKGADILRQPTILANSRKGIELSAKQVVKDGDNAIEVSFKYLDHNDGAVIEVLHTTSQGIKVSGNIIGTSKIRYIGEFVPTIDQPFVNALINNLIYVVVPLVCIGALLWTFRKEVIQGNPAYIILLVFFFIVYLGAEWVYFSFRRFPRWSVVKS